MTPPSDISKAVLGGQRRALAKAITLVESTRADHQAEARQLLQELLPRTGQALRVGISGVPGVGKSTFIEAFGLYLVGEGHRVAVLAVDPSSSISGGSILGDKTRMPRLGASEQAFIRPSPSAGSLGGVARRTREAMLLCEAAGYDTIVVETVGVGQSEYTVASMVDCFLLLMLAGAGDELQGIKRGIVELADILAINKADGDNEKAAARAAAQLKSALSFLRSPTEGWTPPVLTVSALEERGMDKAWKLVLEHRRHLEDHGLFDKRRAEQREAWLTSMIHDGLEQRFYRREDVQELLPRVRADVDSRRITPTEGARRLLELLED